MRKNLVRRGVAAAAAAAVLGAIVAAAVVLGFRSGASAKIELLPDLSQAAPGKLEGRTLGAPGALRFHLGFASAVDNVGAGPLVIVGHRPSQAQKTMTADQVIDRSDGSTTVVPRVGELRYVRSETHSHWHVLGFDRYELRRLDGFALVEPDRKTGFCLGDRYETDPSHALPGEPQKPVWTRACGRYEPRLITVREGLSVGYGDDYRPTLEGQYFDLTNLPAGRYLLVHRVNVDHRLRESNYENNAASLVFKLSWPRGHRQSPTIDVLRRCPDSPFCEPK